MADRARAATDAALARLRLADPRPVYRDLLRHLKQHDPQAFAEANERYETEVLPAVAAPGADAVAEWIRYGRWAAARVCPGVDRAVDSSGRARSAREPHDPQDLLLHVPDDERAPILLLSAPAAPSAAQQATLQLLVRPVNPGTRPQ